MSVRLSTEQGLEREVGGSKLAIRTAYWPAFNIPSIPFQSTGFLWIHNSYWISDLAWFSITVTVPFWKLWVCLRYRMLKLRLGELRCEKLSDRRRFAYFQGDFMATTEVDLALLGLPSGWCRVFYRCFCHRVPHHIHILPSMFCQRKYMPWRICNWCNFSTTTSQKRCQEAVMRSRSQMLLMRRHGMSSHDLLEISWELWFYTFASLFCTFVL